MRTEFLDIAGKRLETAWSGPGPAEAPTLVFLHEGLGSLSQWRDFPQEMGRATDCGVLVYSRAGYGRSDPVDLPRPATYLHHEALEVLPALLDATGVRRAILVGHSDGASIALIHAGAVRDGRVLGAVCMAPHVFNEDSCIAGIAEARKAFETTPLRDRLARHHDHVDVAFRGWNDTWLSPDFRTWDITEYLPGISVPLLLIQGRQDEYATAAHLDTIEARSGGQVETLWLSPCRHAPHKDRPEDVAHALVDFVGRALEEDAARRAEEEEAGT